VLWREIDFPVHQIIKSTTRNVATETKQQTTENNQQPNNPTTNNKHK